MKLLEEQFLAFSQQTAKDLDGPDAVEGAVWICDNKARKGKKTVIKQGRGRKMRY